jgi:hypothetical protein
MSPEPIIENADDSRTRRDTENSPEPRSCPRHRLLAELFVERIESWRLCYVKFSLLLTSSSGTGNPPRNVALLDCALVPSELIAVMHLQIIEAGANTGRSEGATAEKAVPFLCAARRSFVVS